MPPLMLRKMWVTECCTDFDTSKYCTCRLGQRSKVAMSDSRSSTVVRVKLTLKASEPTGQPRTRTPSRLIFASGMVAGKPWSRRRAEMGMVGE